MKTLLRLLNQNLFISAVHLYLDEVEEVVTTTDPEEAKNFEYALDSKLYADDLFAKEVNEIIDYVEENYKTMIEVVHILEKETP